MKTYTGLIKKLNPHQIFVFGSNLQGFHGAGSAGYASFGVSGNHWRDFEYHKKLNGWKGLWNVKGIGQGLQEGTRGWSYALPTVTKPGAKKSITQKQILVNIDNLYKCAYKNLNFEFLIAYTGENPNRLNFNGYTTKEISQIFNQLIIPKNIIFEEKFRRLVDGLF
jgi:hypothetical protein